MTAAQGKSNSTALVAAAFAVLLLPGVVGGIGPLLVAVAPAIGFGILYGLQTRLIYGTLLAVMVAAIGLELLNGHAGLGLLTIQATGISTILATSSRRGWSGPQTALACFAFLVWTLIFSIFLIAGGDLKAWYIGFMERFANEIESVLRQYGELAGRDKGMEQWLPLIKKELIRLFPGFLGLSLAAISVSNVVVAALFIQRFWGKRAFEPSFENWKLPEALVWVVISAGALALFGQGAYQDVGLNILYIIGFFYFVQGLAIVHFLIKRMHMPWYIRWPIYILILIQWYGLLMLALIGLADVWVDFRARLEPEDDNNGPD